MECQHCAFPNPFWSRRCDRCGASLHSKWMIVGLPILAILILLAGLLLLARP